MKPKIFNISWNIFLYIDLICIIRKCFDTLQLYKPEHILYLKTTATNKKSSESVICIQSHEYYSNLITPIGYHYYYWIKRYWSISHGENKNMQKSHFNNSRKY